MDKDGNIVNGQRMFLQPINTCVMPDVPNLTLPTYQQFMCKFSIPITQQKNEDTFKVGVMAIYDTGSSDIINPSNVTVFKLGLSLPANISVFNAGVSAIKTLQDLSTSPLSSDKNILGTADGQFEMIKSSLGGYPDQLFINQSIGADTLNQALSKQLSLGIIDIKVSGNLNTIPPSNF
jgi:hypothetical protein